MTVQSLFGARLAIVPFAFLEWGIVYIYFKYFHYLDNAWSAKRVVFWCVMFLSGICIPLAQIFIYRRIAAVVGHISDLFLAYRASSRFSGFWSQSRGNRRLTAPKRQVCRKHPSRPPGEPTVGDGACSTVRPAFFDGAGVRRADVLGRRPRHSVDRSRQFSHRPASAISPPPLR